MTRRLKMDAQKFLRPTFQQQHGYNYLKYSSPSRKSVLKMSSLQLGSLNCLFSAYTPPEIELNGMKRKVSINLNKVARFGSSEQMH